jgi:6-phosphogluconolactonase
VSVDRSGRNVLVANFTSGSAAVLPIKQDSSLSEASAVVRHTGSSLRQPRQSSAHIHSINLAPDNRFAILADLGLDRVFTYRFDAIDGSLSEQQPPSVKMNPGSGPRHFAFHPNGRFAYVISEMASTVTAFDYDGAQGTLHTLQTVSSLPKDFHGESTGAEVHVHPNGRFLYGSNRGHNSIAVFAIDQAAGTLTPVEYVPTQGNNPRNFGIDPTGTFLLVANRGTNNVVMFRIDPGTGRLSPTGQNVRVGSPVCVRFAAR